MTIREISRLTGISPATISRMLKNPASVKASTRSKIKNVLESLAPENKLNPKFAERLVFILPELNNTFFLDLFYGVSFVAQQKNIPLEIYLSHENVEAEQEIFKKIASYHRTGVLWIPAAGKREKSPIPQNSMLLIAVVDRDVDIEGINLKVLCDNSQAAKKAADILINEGVKNPVIITGDANLSNSRERREGFFLGLPPHFSDSAEQRVFYGDFNNSESAYDIMQALLLHTPAVDGVLTANHILGLGVLKALKKNQITVPDTIKMVTFDRIPSDGLVGVPITEVVFPAYDIGVKAAETLLEQDSYSPPKQSYHFSAQIYFPVPKLK